MHYVLPLNQGGIAVLLGAGSRVQDVGSLTSGLAALAQPFKLRLCRAGHESQLRDYSSNVVLIEPLATISLTSSITWNHTSHGGGFLQHVILLYYPKSSSNVGTMIQGVLYSCLLLILRFA